MRLEENKDHLVCQYCRHQHFPDPDADGIRVLGLPSPVPCPVCRVRLTHAAAAGQRLLFCESCRGMLIPVTSFLNVVTELRSRRQGPSGIPRAANLEDLRRALDCPHCRKRMDTHPYAGPGNIIIDNCPACGVNWLDHSELRRIVTAPDASAPPTPLFGQDE
jgi:Zn-finger nucleic acid-binding protein